MAGFFASDSLRTLTPEEIRDGLASGSITLVDVREDAEWASGHIAGALHKPLSRLRDLVSTIPADKPVVFQCLSGGRSAQAVQLCRSLGLPHDTHLGGGITLWKARGLPVVR